MNIPPEDVGTPGSSITSGMSVASSLIFSLMLSRRRRSTALCDSRLLRRFSFTIAALNERTRTCTSKCQGSMKEGQIRRQKRVNVSREMRKMCAVA